MAPPVIVQAAKMLQTPVSIPGTFGKPGPSSPMQMPSTTPTQAASSSRRVPEHPAARAGEGAGTGSCRRMFDGGKTPGVLAGMALGRFVTVEQGALRLGAGAAGVADRQRDIRGIATLHGLKMKAGRAFVMDRRAGMMRRDAKSGFQRPRRLYGLDRGPGDRPRPGGREIIVIPPVVVGGVTAHVDPQKGMAMGQGSLMRGVGEILAALEMPAGLVMVRRRLLMVERRGGMGIKRGGTGRIGLVLHRTGTAWDSTNQSC